VAVAAADRPHVIPQMADARSSKLAAAKE